MNMTYVVVDLKKRFIFVGTVDYLFVLVYAAKPNTICHLFIIS